MFKVEVKIMHRVPMADIQMVMAKNTVTWREHWKLHEDRNGQSQHETKVAAKEHKVLRACFCMIPTDGGPMVRANVQRALRAVLYV
jgi:hypothetical protein